MPEFGLGTRTIGYGGGAEASLSSPSASPPPLPTRSEMEQMFAGYRLAAEATTANNFALTPNGQVYDNGFTAFGEARLLAESARGTSFGIGANLALYTQNPELGVGGNHLGVHRDDEARLYASFGQRGASVQHIVDGLRQVLPWANISIVSWEARVGATGSRNWGGLELQDAFHHNVIAGGTVEHHSLATQYAGKRRIGPYFGLTGFAGSRIGDSPLSVGVRATGQAAPAGTSRMTAGFEVQLDHRDFYVRIGISGSIQESALADFDGAPKDGKYLDAFGAAGYQGKRGSGFEFRISQNPQGTGLGTSALGDDRNLSASIMGRVTTDSIAEFVRKLCF